MVLLGGLLRLWILPRPFLWRMRTVELGTATVLDHHPSSTDEHLRSADLLSVVRCDERLRMVSQLEHMQSRNDLRPFLGYLSRAVAVRRFKHVRQV